MNICVCGYYGFGNFGDELFLKTLSQQFAEDHIFPYSPYIDLSKIDAVIIGGGDLITPNHYNHNYFPEALKGYPTWVYGVGIVNYYPEDTWPEKEVNKYRDRLQGTQGLFLRDKWSAEIAHKKQFHSIVKLVPDIAMSYKKPNYPIRFSDDPVIGVCTSAYDSFPFENVVKILAELSHRKYHIALIPVILDRSNPYSERDTCIKLKESIQAANPAAAVTVVNPTNDLDLTYSYIQSVDYLITFKLHPSIAALRNGVPVLCLSKLGKVRSFLEAFDLQKYMIGYDEPIYGIMEKVEMLLSEGIQKVSSVLPLIQLKEKMGTAELQALRETIRKKV